MGRLGVFFSDRERRDVRCFGREEETGVPGSSLCSDILKKLSNRLKRYRTAYWRVLCTVTSKFKAIQPGIYLDTGKKIRYSNLLSRKKGEFEEFLKTKMRE